MMLTSTVSLLSFMILASTAEFSPPTPLAIQTQRSRGSNLVKSDAPVVTPRPYIEVHELLRRASKSTCGYVSGNAGKCSSFELRFVRQKQLLSQPVHYSFSIDLS